VSDSSWPSASSTRVHRSNWRTSTSSGSEQPFPRVVFGCRHMPHSRPHSRPHRGCHRGCHRG
jgi:hypothetical protein